MSKPRFLDLLFGVTHRLDSRKLLEPKLLFALTGPVSFLTSISTSGSAELSEQIVAAVRTLIVLASLALLVLLIRHFWLRYVPAGRLSPVWPLAVGFALGVAKVALTMFLEGGEADRWATIASLARLVQGGVLGSWAVLFATAVPSLLSQFELERRALILRETTSVEELLTIQERRDLSSLSDELSRIIEAIKADEKTQLSQFGTVMIREIVDSKIRPLSDSLFKEGNPLAQGFSVRELFDAALRRSPSPWLLALLGLSSISYNLTLVGGAQGLLVILLGATLVWWFLVFLNWAVSRLGIQGNVSFVSLSLTPVVVQFVILGVVTGLWLLDFILWSALALLYLQTSILYSMAKVALSSSAQTRALRQSLPTSESFFALRRRDKANQIHGEVQSKMMSLVLRAESGNEIPRQALISQLQEILELLKEARPQVDTVESGLEKLRSTWEPFAKLDVVTGLSSVSPIEEHALLAIINEGVSNAIRHGLASTVIIRIEPDFLVIEDNGIGPTSGRPGLGTALFEATSTSWSLQSLPNGGARLEVFFSRASD
jgi:hypothetical protein